MTDEELREYLREHQYKAFKKLTNGKILCGKPGSGKSRVAAAYYKENEAPRDVYVITTAKKRDSFDWQEEFYKLGIGPLSGPVPIPDAGGKAGKGRGKSRTDAGASLPAAGKLPTDDYGASPSGFPDVGRDVQVHHPRRVRGEVSTTVPGAGDGGTLVAKDGQASVRLGVHQQGTDAGVGGDDYSRAGDGTGGGNADLSREDSGKGEAGRVSARGFEAGAYPWVLTVDSWNNIAKYADVAGAFFIFDEQRLVGSGDWTRKFLRIAKHNRWILLSGTPGDTWMDYIPVFVANNFYKNRSEFKREHVVYNTFTKFPKVDRYIGVGRLIRHRASLLVDMPFERHTKRRVVEVPLEYDKELLETVLKRRWHVYEDRPLRDVAEMFSIGRKVVNSDPSRLEMVKELWQNHPKLIVFYNFNYELEILRSLDPSNTIEKTNDYSKTKTGSTTKTGFSGSSDTTSTLINVDGSRSIPFSTSRISETSGNFRDEGLRVFNARDVGPVSNSNQIYVGRPSKWGNPFEIGRDGTREQVIAMFREYILASNLMNDLHELRGKDLVCWCHPLACHADVLMELANSHGRIASDTSTGGSKSSKNTKAHSGENSHTTAIAEWNGHKHEPIPKTDRWLYLVQYIAGAEAWDCIETDAMIMYSRNYSWKVLDQSRGRIDRLNTPFKDLWYYDFTSDSFIDRAIGRSLDAKGTFNESAFKGLFVG